MADLLFDGFAHKLTYFNKDGIQVGDGWYANNVVDRSVKNLRFLPDGEYHFLDAHLPHKHGGAKDNHGILVDSPNGGYGSYGIFRLRPFTALGHYHAGVGIHAGRANKGGADHPTHGCIRTTEDVMVALVYYIMNDPLRKLFVNNNHDQHSKHPHYQGDAHLNLNHIA